MTSETSPSPGNGPVDPFAVLGFEKRPWIDLDELQKRVDDCARKTHPDAAGENSAFAELNAAAEQLRHPHLRLAALLSAPTPAERPRLEEVPADLSPIVFRVAEECRLASEQLAKKPSSALANALRNRRLQESANRLQELDRKVDDLLSDASRSLKNLDVEWDRLPASRRDAGVQTLRARFAFLHRASTLLAEALAGIAIELPAPERSISHGE